MSEGATTSAFRLLTQGVRLPPGHGRPERGGE
jgi:hypothetical protein